LEQDKPALRGLLFITIDNTVDVRLSLTLEQDKPAIRGLLFPLK